MAIYYKAEAIDRINWFSAEAFDDEQGGYFLDHHGGEEYESEEELKVRLNELEKHGYPVTTVEVPEKEFKMYVVYDPEKKKPCMCFINQERFVEEAEYMNLWEAWVNTIGFVYQEINEHL